MSAQWDNSDVPDVTCSVSSDWVTKQGGNGEQHKYELMWQHPEYRRCVPGAQVAEQFLRLAQPHKGSTVIDFGCGTGEGSLLIAVLSEALFSNPVKVHMLDFARNCLDEDVRNALTTQAQSLQFTQHDLTQPVPITAPLGFCTDVMEHIPESDVDKVLTNILQAAQHVFFQISCVDDSCGVLIGEKLHLSVHPPAWWLSKFYDLKCTIHYWQAPLDGSSCMGYVSAWATGQEIVDKGELNIEVEQIRTNVRANLEAGWKQVKPHEPANLEVMILGGGPSLNGQLETIQALQAQGVKVITLNGAYHWAREHGIWPVTQIVVDARPFNARFTHPVDKRCVYLIGSQCDPSVLEGLPKERTFLWHTTAETIRDILDEVCPGEWFGVPGGCTVLLRAIPLLKMLGYRKFHLFGCDSCCFQETMSGTMPDVFPVAHHAYAQPENDGVPLYPVTVGGRMFTCTAWQIAQAQELISLVKFMGSMFELEIYGDGLLAWILEHAAQVDIEKELAGLVSDPFGETAQNSDRDPS
jgi:SAM-dependent methyltransferase